MHSTLTPANIYRTMLILYEEIQSTMHECPEQTEIYIIFSTVIRLVERSSDWMSISQNDTTICSIAAERTRLLRLPYEALHRDLHLGGETQKTWCGWCKNSHDLEHNWIYINLTKRSHFRKEGNLEYVTNITCLSIGNQSHIPSMSRGKQYQKITTEWAQKFV